MYKGVANKVRPTDSAWRADYRKTSWAPSSVHLVAWERLWSLKRRRLVQGRDTISVFNPKPSS